MEVPRNRVPPVEKQKPPADNGGIPPPESWEDYWNEYWDAQDQIPDADEQGMES